MPDESPQRSRTKTRPIRSDDRGSSTTDLDLGLTYDPITRSYNRR